MRSLFLTISVLAAVSAFAGVKVAGMEFVPKDLIFAAAEPKSQATAEGTLPDNCKWTFSSETRVGKREEPGGRSTCMARAAPDGPGWRQPRPPARRRWRSRRRRVGAGETRS